MARFTSATKKTGRVYHRWTVWLLGACSVIAPPCPLEARVGCTESIGSPGLDSASRTLHASCNGSRHGRIDLPFRRRERRWHSEPASGSRRSTPGWSVSTLTASVLDQSHGFAAHEDFFREPVAPAEWRHVAIVAKRPAAMAVLEAVAQRCAHVGIRATIEQQPGEPRLVRLSLAVVHPEVALRHDRREQRGVAPDT